MVRGLRLGQAELTERLAATYYYSMPGGNGINLYDLDEYFCSCMFYLNIDFNFTVVLI